ncbi:MAG: sugar ABC transporter permease [Chloroflexi bacterium]|nr:sugar ABC transporter permease [Chloroflexota bacterium]
MSMSTFVQAFRKNIQTYTILIALVLIWVVFAVATEGGYVSPQNISNLFRQMSVTSLMAAGMVLVIVTGGIDLSVGRLAGFVSVVVAYFQANRWNTVFPDQPAVAALLSVLIGLAVGTGWGVMQGYIIAYLRVTAFIVTLGSLFILQGLVLLQTEGKTIPANQPVFSEIGQGYLPDTLGWLLTAAVIGIMFFMLFRGRRNKQKYGFPLPTLTMDIAKTAFYSLLLVVYVAVVNSYKVAPGIPYPVLLLALVAMVMTYVSNNTRFGRYAYAIGGNREAARLSGINIRREIFLIFTLMGFLSGIAGIVLASYVGYGTIGAGGGYELDVIASAILGGTSTLGGIGTIPGAMVGGLIMASLSTGLQMLNAPPAATYVIKGVVLVVAVVADMYFKKSKS